jgi:hypothetical protein
MTLSIDFSWHKDASGYRLEKKLLPGDEAPADRIMPNGGERLSTRPMEIPDIYRIFANVDSAERLLEFVEKFGMLWNFEDAKQVRLYQDPDEGSKLVKWDNIDDAGMPVGIFLKQAALFHDALSLKTEGSEQLAAFLKSIKIPKFGDLSLVPDRVFGARFQIRPLNLMDALWLQLGQVLASGIKLSTCLQCGQLFEVGAGSGRRADAKFCSDEHRTLYHSLNRKPTRRS